MTTNLSDHPVTTPVTPNASRSALRGLKTPQPATAARRAYANSIYGPADRLPKAGFIGLGQNHGHVLHAIIHIAWFVAQPSGPFLNRLDKLLSVP
jgi:hypothetical protein